MAVIEISDERIKGVCATALEKFTTPRRDPDGYNFGWDMFGGKENDPQRSPMERVVYAMLKKATEEQAHKIFADDPDLKATVNSICVKAAARMFADGKAEAMADDLAKALAQALAGAVGKTDDGE